MSGRTEIFFEGLNLNGTLRALSRNFVLFDVSRNGKRCKITVDSKVYRQVVAFLEERCYNITKVQKRGSDFALFQVKAHFVLALIFVVAIVALAISSNICLKVEISGDFSADRVLAALDESGFRVGSSLSGFSADRLENSLATNLDAMYAVVNRKGSVLYINAVKRKTASSLDMRVRSDLLSDCDGVVESVLCEQGTLAVKVGDTVRKGDVLIYGYRTFNDGTTSDVCALGKIVVRQSAQGFAKFVGTITQTVETGNVFQSNYVVLFGKSYGNSPNFASFRSEETSVFLFPLNLEIRRVTYLETKQITQTATIEECLEQLKTEAFQNAVSEANFFVKYTLYTVTDGGVYATVFGEKVISR